MKKKLRSGLGARSHPDKRLLWPGDARVIAQTVNGGKGKLLKEQRGWLIYTIGAVDHELGGVVRGARGGRFEGFLDETSVWSSTGYSGDRALFAAFPNALLLGGEIPVSRSTFKFYQGIELLT